MQDLRSHCNSESMELVAEDSAGVWPNEVNLTSSYSSAPDSRSGLCRFSHSTSPVSPDSLSTAHTPLCSAANGNALSAVLSFSTAQGCDPGGASLQDTEKPTSACFLFHSQCLAHRCLINAGRRPRVYLSLLLDFMVAQKSKPSATSLSCFLKTSCVWCEAAWCLPL